MYVCILVSQTFYLKNPLFKHQVLTHYETYKMTINYCPESSLGFKELKLGKTNIKNNVKH